MENNAKSQTQKAVVADGELLALMNLAGVKPGRSSPLALVTGKAAPPEALRRLQTSGLVDGSNRPTAACQEFLNILANPGTEIDLLWGNPDGVSLSKVYALAGQDKLVAFTGADGNSNIAYFLSPQDLTDLVVEKTARPAIDKEAGLDIETGAAAVPVFFALLDLYREAQLKAALERRQEFEVKAGPEEVLRLLQEAKVDSNLAWYAPVGAMLLPDGVPLTEAAVGEGLSALKSQGMLGADGVLSDAMTSFAFRAFPLTAYVGIKVTTVGGGTAEKAQLALFRGFSTLLFVQAAAGGGKTSIINSIPTTRLPELLFNLAVRPFEAPAAPPAAPVRADGVVCGKCGTQNAAGAKFCAKCGAALAAPASAKFCAKCGTAAKAGEKFCKKCGAKLP
jgi:hypothetical protein